MRNIHIELANRLLRVIYNPQNQPLQLVSEMAELTQEIMDSYREDKIYDENNLVEEIGDVLNAIDSVILLLNINKAELDQNRSTKLLNYIEKRERHLK